MDSDLDGSVDAVGQWLTQLPLIGQTIVLLAILVPVGGAAAFAFIGLIDVVVGRVSGRWAQRIGPRGVRGSRGGEGGRRGGEGRRDEEGRPRIELSERDPR